MQTLLYNLDQPQITFYNGSHNFIIHIIPVTTEW
jgi:hypothetical protein